MNLENCVYFVAQTDGIDLPLPCLKAPVRGLRRPNQLTLQQRTTSTKYMFGKLTSFNRLQRAKTSISIALDSGGGNLESPISPKHPRLKFVRQMSRGYSLKKEQTVQQLSEGVIQTMVRIHSCMFVDWHAYKPCHIYPMRGLFLKSTQPYLSQVYCI